MIYEANLEDGARMRLRPFTREDMTPTYVGWFHDRDVTRHNSHGLFPYTRAQQEAWAQELEMSTGKIVWAIEVEVPDALTHTKDWTMVGNCSLQSINHVNRSGEVAIVIGDKEYWGLGIAEQAVRSMLAHAFMCLGLNRVWTGTAATNLGMQKVAEKCGFMLEGKFRQGMFLQGKFEDVYAYGILREEFGG